MSIITYCLQSQHQKMKQKNLLLKLKLEIIQRLFFQKITTEHTKTIIRRSVCFNWHPSPCTFYRHFDQRSNNLLSMYQPENHSSCKDSRQASLWDQHEAICVTLSLFCISQLQPLVEFLHAHASSIAPSLSKPKI